MSSRDGEISSLWLKGSLSKEQYFLARHLFAHVSSRTESVLCPCLRAGVRHRSPLLLASPQVNWEVESETARGLPHAKEEVVAALRFRFPRLSPTAAGRVRKKRQLVIFRHRLYFLQPVSVAHFISLPDLTKQV